MEDVIRLLPDAVANQIAAGEVVQRPASVVKELLENAVDAGATNIQLIIKDAGRTLIQVVDNGKGMSFNDARLCFERHATSKLRSADDLFHISTKGFRGEALASIAAIAHVELKTKTRDSEMGTMVLVEGTEVREHSPAVTPDGTSIAVKNLFFNVPARRNFLKSDKVEFAHIEEEFYRVALIHRDIQFNLYHDGKLLLQLPSGNFKQRIVNVFGSHLDDKLFPVELDHEIMKIYGFIAKPENSKKQKSEQYMFINNRYVRHNLLNFAVEKAYSDLIPQGYHPAYFIAIEIDPSMIDVNVSPTKVEVKLQDERLFFGFLNSAVKKSLGMMSLSPMIDFDESAPFAMPDRPDNREIVEPRISVNTDYNPFDKIPERKNSSPFQQFSGNGFRRSAPTSDDWRQFLNDLNVERVEQTGLQRSAEFDGGDGQKVEVTDDMQFFLFRNKYMFFKLNDSAFVADLQNMHERILFDGYVKAMKSAPVRPQQSLFPQTVTLTVSQTDLAISLKREFLDLGYDLERIDATHIAVNATPNDEDVEGDLHALIADVLDSWQMSQVVHNEDRITSVALGMARHKRSRQRPPQAKEEAKYLLEKLFESSTPAISPSGKPVFHIFNINEITRFFE